MAEGNVPKIGLWAAAVALYVLAAFLLANGSARAFVAYALANPDLRDEFAQFLSDVLALQKAAE